MLRPALDSPVYDCKDYEKAPMLETAATLGTDGSVTIFAVNRALTDDLRLTADLRAFADLALIEHIKLHHDDVKAVNTEDAPACVSPVVKHDGELTDGHLTIDLRPLSWNVIRLEKA